MESEDKPENLLSIMTRMADALERLAKSQEEGLVLMREMQEGRVKLEQDQERKRQGFQ